MLFEQANYIVIQNCKVKNVEMKAFVACSYYCCIIAFKPILLEILNYKILKKTFDPEFNIFILIETAKKIHFIFHDTKNVTSTLFH